MALPLPPERVALRPEREAWPLQLGPPLSAMRRGLGLETMAPLGPMALQRPAGQPVEWQVDQASGRFALPPMGRQAGAVSCRPRST